MLGWRLLPAIPTETRGHHRALHLGRPRSSRGPGPLCYAPRALRASPYSQPWQVPARRYVYATVFPHSYHWGAEAHSPRHSFLQVGCRGLASGQYPPHLRLRSTACFRPFSAPFPASRHNTYTARLSTLHSTPYYLTVSSSLPTIPSRSPSFLLQCHPACHALPLSLLLRKRIGAGTTP